MSEVIYAALIFFVISSGHLIAAESRQTHSNHVIRKRQTTTPTFTQNPYSFTVTSCAAGGTVGQVTATVTGGTVTVYTISSSSGKYTIATTGLITLLTATPTAETFTVTAYATTGFTATATVTVTTTCSSSGSTTTLDRTPPVFQQSQYTFSTACSSTQRLQVGLILASNSRSDTLNYTILNPLGSPFFVDPNSGLIKTYVPLATAGTYSLTAQASDPYGNAVTVPVTVTVSGTCVCSGTAACAG
ncbi:hypothetical protein BV898_09730 [Hypsibius exemplaris]|uniref:Cadherin domain-containing protein n=1 Tax=Hypsibius exemplaris TaxID=2072580 RepID=A0A1W0WLL8_HYPEX|nr:hypothetical protein BV898_09730 [Hypsibius exemplaris]